MSVSVRDKSALGFLWKGSGCNESRDLKPLCTYNTIHLYSRDNDVVFLFQQCGVVTLRPAECLVKFVF